MGKDTYLVEKSTGTFADELVFLGVGYIINNIAQQAPHSIEVNLRDYGDHYRVLLSRPLEEQWVEQCRYFTPAPLIVTTDKKGNQKPMSHPPMRFIDYEAERSRNSRYFELRKQLAPAAKRPGATIDEFPELRDVEMHKPLPDWPIYAVVNQMSAINAYNGMVMAWHEAKEKACFSQQLHLILHMFEQLPNDIGGAIAAWKKLKKDFDLSAKPNASATQVFNPATGKGANKPKADGLSIGGASNFWLIEYLKLVGMFQIGLPRTVKGVKDRKTYVILPNNIPFNTSKKLFRDFNDVMFADTAIKMDILAALRFTTIFLKQWRAGQRRLTSWQTDQSGRGQGQSEAPSAYVTGLAMVFYKNLGSAHAVLNQSTINLPRWVDAVNTRQDAQHFIDILTEHEAVIRQLKEDRSQEYELLRTYRDFLSSGNLRDFFAFTASFSGYITGKIEKKEYVNQFSTGNLEVLMMAQNKDLRTITENEGFRRIADAIRRSTVQAQYFRYQQNDKRYEIRYGLGQELIRKGKYKQEFIKALSEFLAKYNQENGMVEEQTAKRYSGQIPDEVRRSMRSSVQFSDIDQIVDLIEEFDDAELVCNLLVAYGYARSPRKTEPNKQEDQGA